MSRWVVLAPLPDRQLEVVAEEERLFPELDDAVLERADRLMEYAPAGAPYGVALRQALDHLVGVTA